MASEFYNLFQHVDSWLKADGKAEPGTGFLFVPQIMDMTHGQSQPPGKVQQTPTDLVELPPQSLPESTPETVPDHGIDPEYLAAVLVNRQHVKDRENRKRKQEEEKTEDVQYVDMSAKETLELNTKRKSTVEQKLAKRRRLYADESADGLTRIEALENELQKGFDDFMKKNRPKLWPCIPIRLVFDD